MLKDIKFILQKLFIPEHLILKRRILRSIKSRIEKEYEAIPLLCNKNYLSIDVGVFRGVYSFLISKHSKLVHGFEANPIMYSYLKRNLWKIANNIDVHNYALSNKVGPVNLKIPLRKKSLIKKNFEDFYEGGLATIHKDNNLDHKNIEEFKTKSNCLDNIKFNERVGFIKIDVEGHEQNVLEGAINLIKKDKPNLLIEIEKKHRKDSIKTTFDFLKNHGYKTYIFNNKKLNLIKDHTKERSVNYIFKVD
jgi:FkbM family methyltransferase